MTCKDCVYSPICKLYAGFGVTDVPYDENDICKLFRSKIDFVEVVRCSECKHRDKIGLCQAEGQKLTIVKDNHFCSKGEKWTSSDEALSPKTKQAILDDFMKNSEQ